MYGGYYSSWILFVFPAMLFASYAQMKISSAYNKYSRVPSGTGYTGAQIARMILDRNGLYDVRIEQTPGQLSDHYDPRTRVLRLSNSIHNGSSVASMSVAAHEVGHALQHADGYFPLVLRNNIAPIVSIGSRLVWVFIILGFIISPFFIEVGIMLFLGVVLFQIITLPVEINASRRALLQLENGILSYDKLGPSKEMLKAAALTYVASTLVAVGELLRLLFMTRGRRD
jgi:Zn-dependent membrane protease YugP